MVMIRFQMLILVYECKGLRPFFSRSFNKGIPVNCGESSYTQISGEVIYRLPEKSRGFYLVSQIYP